MSTHPNPTRAATLIRQARATVAAAKLCGTEATLLAILVRADECLAQALQALGEDEIDVTTYPRNEEG